MRSPTAPGSRRHDRQRRRRNDVATLLPPGTCNAEEVPPIAPAPQIRISSLMPTASSGAASATATFQTSSMSASDADGGRRSCRRRFGAGSSRDRLQPRHVDHRLALVGKTTPGRRVRRKFSIRRRAKPDRSYDPGQRLQRVPPVAELDHEARIVGHHSSAPAPPPADCRRGVDDQDASEPDATSSVGNVADRPHKVSTRSVMPESP